MVTQTLTIDLKSGDRLCYEGLEEDCWWHEAGCTWLTIYPSGKVDGCAVTDDIIQIRVEEIVSVRCVRNPKYDKELMAKERREFEERKAELRRNTKELKKRWFLWL
jgi:hypothetical protein